MPQLRSSASWGSPPIISALASPMKGDDVRRLAFAQHVDILEVDSVGKGRASPPTSGHNLHHRHKDPLRKVSPEANREAMMRGIQSAWRLAYEADACRADELPDFELYTMLTDEGYDPPPAERPFTAGAARGCWILDSGASEHLVSKNNLSKRDLRGVSNDGPSVTLSTANGLVEQKSRATLELPTGTGTLAPVHAIVLEDMVDLNLVSMGRLIADQRFASFWSPDHGLLWRDPVTLNWVRLKVENHVPLLEPADDQSGITEALRAIFGSVEPASLAPGHHHHAAHGRHLRPQRDPECCDSRRQRRPPRGRR